MYKNLDIDIWLQKKVDNKTISWYIFSQFEFKTCLKITVKNTFIPQNIEM